METSKWKLDVQQYVCISYRLQGSKREQDFKNNKKGLNREQLRCSVYLFVMEHSGSGNVRNLLKNLGEISLAYANYANCANPKQGVLGKYLGLFENGCKA